jgi:hypothetical protein
MGVVGKSRYIVIRIIGAKLVQQQKWIEMIESRRANDARHSDTRTVAGGLAPQLAQNGSLSH